MKHLLVAICTASLFLSASADITQGGFGAKRETQPASEAARKSKSQAKRTSYPFHGTLASIDSSGKALTLEGKKKNRVILVTPETRIFRNGTKADLKDGNAGERVTGTVEKNSSGQEEAITVRFGEKTNQK